MNQLRENLSDSITNGKQSSTGAKVEDDVIVRTALNAITDEWETFVQSILGRADLPDWDSL